MEYAWYTSVPASVPDEIAPEQIKSLRERNHVSQPVFARYLNTSVSTVQKWESGVKRPNGLSLKPLTVVQKHGLKENWRAASTASAQPSS